jgi:hypothetical protein
VQIVLITDDVYEQSIVIMRELNQCVVKFDIFVLRHCRCRPSIMSSFLCEVPNMFCLKLTSIAIAIWSCQNDLWQ